MSGAGNGVSLHRSIGSGMVPGMISGMDNATKARENRLRSAAARQQLRLTRSRRRDRLGWDYGRYWLAPARGRGPVIGDERGRKVGDPPGLTLDQVEAYLTRPRDRAGP